jgi:Secretion system C-terminal sorting domain
MKQQLFFFLLIILTRTDGNAQSVSPATVNVTGGTNMFTHYRVEWSVGEEAAVETLGNGNIIVTQGLLQPYTHNPATVFTGTGWGIDEIRIMPNPTRDWIEIDLLSKDQGKISFTLINSSGQVMLRKQFDYQGTGRIEKMDMGRYPAGAYFLEIHLEPTGNSTRKKGAFKIIKIS